MLTKYLLNLGTKGSKDYEDSYIRGRVGYVAGMTGLVTNILLSLIKLIIGLVISSIAVIADAFNNLTDAASSLITIVGFKLSNMPPDKNHPYGHGRMEYLAALMISFMVMIVGFQFVKSSLNRIINPEPIRFQWVSLIILIISIFFKVWLSIFNRKLGNKISSTALKAISMDALWDVVITSIIVLSLILSFVTDFPIDGYVGILVSMLILYSGLELIKETINPLIGEAPDSELAESIRKEVLSYEHILGVHDLILHSYGPGKIMGTIDAEVPWDMDLITIHGIVDRAEREISEKYNLHLVVHIDPVGMETEEEKKVRKKIKSKIKGNELIDSIHDFNIVEENDGKCVIFHLVVDGNQIDNGFCKESLKKEITELVKQISPVMDCDIVVDIEY